MAEIRLEHAFVSDFTLSGDKSLQQGPASLEKREQRGKCAFKPTHQFTEARPQVRRGAASGVPGHAARAGLKASPLPLSVLLPPCSSLLPTPSFLLCPPRDFQHRLETFLIVTAGT